MIIDFHTHIFPPAVAAKAIPKLEEDAGVTAYADGTEEGLLASMGRAGIDYSVTLPVATNPDSVPSINRFAISRMGRPGLISFGAAHPAYPDNEGELRRLKEAGVRGIKLHPDYQDAFVDDEATVRLLQTVRELGLIAVVHGGADFAFPIHHCTPERVARILPRLQGLTLVVAHYGGNDYLDDVERLYPGTGVYIDTSFTHNHHGHREQCARLLRSYPQEQILFASDSPWDDQAGDVAFIKGLGLPAEREQAIFSGNARRLLDLPPG